MHVTTRREQQCFSTRKALIPVILTAVLGAAGPAGAQLVNPGFDAGPLGPVFNFGTVVGPPAQYGFWGAEAANIVTTTNCGTGPRSTPNMLRLDVGGGTHSQAWQAVDVSAGPPGTVSLRAWGNTCLATPGAIVGVDIRTFNNANGWPSHTVIASSSLVLDGNVDTWEQAVLNCVVVPPDTKWILAQVFLVNATSGNTPAYIDDVELIFDQCPVSVQETTWSRVKLLMDSRSH